MSPAKNTIGRLNERLLAGASCVKSNARLLTFAAEASLYRREAGEREKEGALVIAILTGVSA